MYFIAPGIRIFTQDTLKVIPFLLLQLSLCCVPSNLFAVPPGIDSSPGNGAGGSAETNLIDCIFEDGFEACLTYIDGYPDTDSDGFGDAASDPTSFCNNIRDGYVDNNQDCNDATDAMFPGNTELCDGLDNDCNAASIDGSEDPGLNLPCDGADNDLCVEGIQSCAGGVLVCSDTSADNLDLCDGADNDCDVTSADGSEDPAVGLPCDGPDSDLCVEGIQSCAGGVLICSDNTGSDLDLCDGLDNDCDVTSADGSEDPAVGLPCDGPDSDLCEEGIQSCAGGALICSDNSGDNLEVCDGSDNDCDGVVDEGCVG